MSLFRRSGRDRPDPRPAVERFWQWWAENRSQVLGAAARGEDGEVRRMLGPAVEALDPGLRYAIEPGTDAFHRLVVTAAGRTDLLALAERWRVGAPPADDEVEYVSRRVPDPRVMQYTREIDDFDIAYSELTAVVRVDRDRAKVDVVVHHPLFPLLSRDHRLEVATEAVHGVLGEDDVERWLGELDVSGEVALDPIDLSTLPMVIGQLSPGRTGTPTGGWVTLTGRAGKSEIRATVRRPFGPADAPLCDTHVAIVLPYPAGADGLPEHQGVDDQVDRLIEQVVEALGGAGPHVVLVGKQFGARRAIAHLYVDSLEVEPDQARDVVSSWPHGGAVLRAKFDPAYRGVGHLLS
ncbi:MAG TPA: hypothetical protein VK053_09660 [Jiangellaceae bacterium]|nr:hypothetical protein [Jiangellaceae bacterium]